jgi:hypothetical protein
MNHNAVSILAHLFAAQMGYDVEARERMSGKKPPLNPPRVKEVMPPATLVVLRYIHQLVLKVVP